MTVRFVVLNGEVVATVRVEDGSEEVEVGETGEAGAEEAAGEEVEPPNPILPEGKEVFWAALAFALLLAALYVVKRGLPSVTRGMDARAERIRGDLEAAERARAEAARLQQEYERSLVGARAEAAAVLEEARGRVEARRAEALRELGNELAAGRAQAGDDLAAERRRAIERLHQTVSELAVGAAERVLERPVDRQAATQVVERYLSETRSLT